MKICAVVWIGLANVICLSCLKSEAFSLGHSLQRKFILHAESSQTEGQRYARNKGQRNSQKSQKASILRKKSRQLNQRIVGCQNASELLSLLQKTKGALTETRGGDALSNVNFSTSIHRLCKHSMKGREARSKTLQDARFALLLAGAAEGLVSGGFGAREFSNISWALAKLRLVPPKTSMVLSKGTDREMLTAAAEVRKAVMETARSKRQGEFIEKTWIPALSQLAAYIMDHIGQKAAGLISTDAQLQEWSNILWSHATAQRADEEVFKRIAEAMVSKQYTQKGDETWKPQEWSNTVWALATAQIFVHENVLQSIAEKLQGSPDLIKSFKPQEISNTAWGIATLLSRKPDEISAKESMFALVILRACADELILRCDDFKTQEVSNTIWALATIGFGLGGGNGDTSGGANNYVVLKTEFGQEDSKTRDEVLQVVGRIQMSTLQRFRSQELNNLAWSLARLVNNLYSNQNLLPLIENIGVCIGDTKRFVTSQDIGTTMWSLATLGYTNDDVYRKMSYRVLPGSASDRYKPQELSNIVWALATAEVQVGEIDAFDVTWMPNNRPQVRDPVTRAFGTAAVQLMKRPWQFKNQEIKDILWAFSKSGIRHPKLFRSVGLHLVGMPNTPKEDVRGLSEFSTQGLGNTAWAIARQAQLVDRVATRNPRAAKRMGSTTGRLAVYSTISLDIGETLLHRLLGEIVDSALSVHNGLKNCRPQDISNTAWSMAVLGLRHDRFLEAANFEINRRLSSYITGKERSAFNTFKGQEIANILWTLATLNNAAIGDETLAVVADYTQTVCSGERRHATVEGIAKVFNRQELANIAWSCAVFGKYPGKLMHILYRGLLGTGEKESPEYIASVFGDGGLQSQAIMSLVYVQSAMEFEKVYHIKLPDGFPEGWGQFSDTQAGKASPTATENSIELNLSTSKIQREVSRAFSTIGLDYVDEHVISMEAMVKEYGVDIPPLPLDFLSIDIANMEQKLAIEVDGPAHYVNVIESVHESEGTTTSNGGRLEYQFRWSGDRQVQNGPTILKHRLLESMGWRVIHIPFWEWRDLENEEDRGSYCRKALLEKE